MSARKVCEIFHVVGIALGRKRLTGRGVAARKFAASQKPGRRRGPPFYLQTAAHKLPGQEAGGVAFVAGQSGAEATAVQTLRDG